MLIDILNIMGTFFLAVEAIKLKNLITLRETYIVGLFELINPKLEFIEGELDKKEQKSNRIYFFTLLSILFLTGTAFNTILLLKVEAIRILFESVNLYLFRILLFLVIAFLTGAIIWTILIYMLKLIEVFLLKIESNTKNGIIGTLGFLLILISFVIKWTIN